jgi:trehalose synthase
MPVDAENRTTSTRPSNLDGMMLRVREVSLQPRNPGSFDTLVPEEDVARYHRAVAGARHALGDHTLWHVNSSADGGGVAELLHALLGYLREDGIATRWLVVEGTPAFFEVTKRIHNRLHETAGDGGPLGPPERSIYDEVLAPQVEPILREVAPGDVVVLHDPQTAGLAPHLARAGVHAIWVCHVGVDHPGDLARSVWNMLGTDVGAADASVFTRRAYVWDGLATERVAIIPPCIDGSSPKNIPIEPTTRRAILEAAGLVVAPSGDATVELPVGGSVTVSARADVVEEDAIPATSPLVLQVSRWDRLKDPVGVMRGFAAHVPRTRGAHLMLAGPATTSVSDDPEGIEVLRDVREAWTALDHETRPRVHLASLPIDDLVENAVVVNALQRHAAIVVQKSLAEGFGLTVTEAMWKERPVVASRIGGIQDQIEDGRSGLLVDPLDAPAFGEAVATLLDDQLRAVEIGHAARSRVRARYLAPHFLAAHLELMTRVIG